MQLKVQHLPESLFKYRFIDDLDIDPITHEPYAVGNLRNNTIWLSKPNALNDPYDCSFDITDEDLCQLFGSEIKNQDIIVAELFKKLEDDGKIEIVKSLRKMFDDRNEQLIQEFSTKSKDAFQRIFSLTERNDSVLMWTHYARNHTGFCIEYDASPDLWEGYFLRCVHPVVYTDSLINIGRFLISENAWEQFISFMLPAFFKAKDWEYEQEWRFVLSYGILDGNLHDALPIKAIYAGARISQTHLETLTEICKEKQIPFYSTEWKARQFNLTFKKVAL